MKCDACGHKFFEKSEKGIYSRYGKNENCIRHNHLCRHCCRIVEKALKSIVLKGQTKHLPETREFI